MKTGKLDDPGASLGWVEPALALFVVAALAAAVAYVGPLATNDGAVHMSFARLLWFGPAGPLQASFYQVERALDPNLLGYLVAGPLIPTIGSPAAETVLQIICVVGIPLAGWAAMASVGRSGAAFVPAFAAFSLNQMFLLGLYNFSLSIAAALLAFASAVRAMRDGGWWWVCLAASLAAAFLAHLAGVVMALVFVAAWMLPSFVEGLTQGTRVPAPRRWRIPALVALIPMMLLLVQYGLRQPVAGVSYGVRPLSRAMQTAELTLLATAGGISAKAAFAMAVLITGFATWAVFSRARRWRCDPASRLDTQRFALLIGGAVLVVMAFPDAAGGGWTHVRRMMPLPFFAALALCAAQPWPAPARRAFAAATSVATLILLGCVTQQQLSLRPALAQFDGLLAEIGPHCTLLPIVPWPDQASASEAMRLHYKPLYQVASRVEQSGDRVALFNFLARLELYPARFRDGLEPQAGIFHWLPRQQDPDIVTVDIAGYERAARVPVDYVITQGDRADLPAGLRDAITGYRPVEPGSRQYFNLYKADPVPGPTSCEPLAAR